MNPILTSNAEYCISAMHLRQDQASEVRKIIINYSKPEDFCAQLSWIFYRIINIAKSLFGKSDWQIAEQIVQERIIDRVNVSLVSCGEPILEQQHETFQRRVHGISASLASELLSLALEIHQNKMKIYPQDPNAKISIPEIEQMDIEKAMGRIKALSVAPGVMIGRASYREFG